MNATVELNLSLILFLPWFVLLSALFWLFPRRPRPTWRTAFDLAALAVSACLSFLAMRWGFLHADLAAGAIWKQVLACLLAYGAFLVALGLAFWLRAALLRRTSGFTG